MRAVLREPLVRIRCFSPEDASRCRSILAAAGLAPEDSLQWLLVRDQSPDEVNEILVSGGALGRTAAREHLGKLIGYLIDRQGDLSGRGPNLAQLVRRALADTGLAARYAPRPEAELVASARALHEELVDTAGGFVSWERYAGAFLAPLG